MANCPFCGSDSPLIQRGDEVKLGDKMNADGEIEYVPVTDYCCEAQKRNKKYIDKNFHPDDAPSIEDISKL